MSFQRRWFLTAAGSVFLASIAGAVDAKGGGKKEDPVKKPVDPEEAAEVLMQALLAGYAPGRKPSDDEEKVLRATLKPLYHDRYFKRHGNPDMDNDKFTLLTKFAGVLGGLAQQCLQHDIKGDCGWDPAKPNAKLGPEHIDRAREILGFALNKKLIADSNSGGCYKVPKETDEKSRQIDKQCPICEMSPGGKTQPKAGK
jgi:hypothetical protein